MGAMASQITSLTTVYSTVYSGADQRKHQSSASLAFVRGIHRWPVNFPHKWPVTRTMLSFDDVILFDADQGPYVTSPSTNCTKFQIVKTSPWQMRLVRNCRQLRNYHWKDPISRKDYIKREIIHKDKINFILCRSIYKQITLAQAIRRQMKGNGYIQMRMKLMNGWKTLKQ